MKRNELKELIQQAINRRTDMYESLKYDLSPQVQKLASEAKGQKDALSDVLSAINGNPVYLNILAGK